jgi:dUTP pyrophosphatase
LKKGVIIANCEGVVDADYVQQTYVMLQNTSDQVFEVRDGDRIAQAEVVPLQQYIFEVSDREPENKTSRTGGLGSTGV